MTTVPAQIKQRIEAKICEGLRVAEAFYGRKFPSPTIVYKQNGGRVAGTANYRTNVIDLNPAILMQNVEEFIERTPLHELAHLITDTVYPEAHNVGIQYDARRGRYVREKREVHGPRWQSVMRALGQEPSRCHNFDTTGLKRITANTRQHVWGCTCGCGKKAKVGAKIHNQLLANPSSRWYHKGFPLKQIFEGAAPVQPKVVAPVAVVVPINVPVATGTKMDKCWSIYKNYSTSGRSAIIQMFVREANCTVAGASTYYQACKKRYEAGVM